MLDFLRESNNFNGIVFNGFFNINLSHLESLYTHYQETGKNLLDDYVSVIHLSWDDKTDGRVMDNEELNRKLLAISRIRRLRLFEPEFIYELQAYCRDCYSRYQQRRERRLSKARRRACTYTAKPNVREWVFAAHGEQCLKCGSDEDLSIDHIVPISRGGKNRLSNLQPLCKSCNSEKGTKIEDYRDGIPENT